MNFKSLFTSAVLLTSLALAGPLLANTEVERQHSFDAEDIRTLHLDNAVGQLKIKPSQDHQIRVEIKLEGQRSGLLRRKKDVSGVELNIRERGDSLHLKLQENNVQADWVLYVPELDKIYVHQGVGAVDVELANTALELSVGVGTAVIKGNKNYLGQLTASAGVGAVSASGLDDYNAHRRVVAEDAKGRGTGNKEVKVEVGVGDIKLTF